MRKIILLNIILFFVGCSSFKSSKVHSPDGSLVVEVKSDNGIISYSVFKNSKSIIENSKLGIISDKFEFSDDLVIKNIKRNYVRDVWSQVWGEQKKINDYYNQLTVTVSPKNNNHEMMIHFRLFDDGLGFRYEIPEQSEIDNFNILDELTQFNFSEDSQSWWIPAYAYRRYEFLYANTLISEINRDKFSELVEYLNGPRIGPEAVQTPFTVQREDGITIAIHEANLANYSSMTLKANGTQNMECDLFPWSDGTKVKTSAPMLSPWRTIIVGENPADIVMSTLTLNLNDPNKLEGADWISPGKYIGLWWEMIGTNQSTWGSGPYHGATTEKVKDYIDFGSENGLMDCLLKDGIQVGMKIGVVQVKERILDFITHIQILIIKQ